MAISRKLNYQHLLYFWSVVRTGSLTRACEARSDEWCTAMRRRSLDSDANWWMCWSTVRRAGTSEVGWMATPELAKTLRSGFPKSLDGAPVLLPTPDTAIRRALEQWLDKHDVHPILLGEFEDYGLLREFARTGHGLAPVPAVQEEQFRREYRLARVGPASPVRVEFYAICVERRIKHPAVSAVVNNASRIFRR